MHEYSITSSIIEIIKNAIKDKSVKHVKKVNFEISPIASLEKESIKFYYGFLTKDDPILKDAVLFFKKSKINAKCLECLKELKIDNLKDSCPMCNSKSLRIIPGEDLKIISIET